MNSRSLVLASILMSMFGRAALLADIVPPTPVPTATKSPTPRPATPAPTIAATPTPTATHPACPTCPPTPGPTLEPTPIPTTTATPTPTPTPPCPVCPGTTPVPLPTATAPAPQPTPTAAPPTPTAPPVACTAPPFQFEPRPPGAARPDSLSTGFTNSMTVYNGEHRLFVQEAFGYSTLQIDTPGAPTALRYDDLRNQGIVAAGDGQSYTFGSHVTADGLRAAIGLGGPGDGWGVVVGTLDYAEGFRFTGSFGLDRLAPVIVHAGGRYVAYGISTAGSSAAEITTLPTTMARHNLDAHAERPTWTGYLPRAVGGFLLFLNGSGLTIVDASNPGPAGALTNGMPTRVLSPVDLGGRGIQYYTAATDGGPNLRVLIELRPLTGEASYTYALVSVVRTGLTATLMGSWKIPTAPGETWAPAGVSAAISNGHVFMPALRMSPSYQAKAYVAPIGGFPGVPVLTTTTGVGFGMPTTTKGEYVYLPTGPAGFVLPCGLR